MSAAALVALLRRRYGPSPTDADLLRAYIDHGDGLAFRGLVERHGPMVRRLCRRLLGDDHAADDAFQATFLTLARRAGSIRRPEALADWLYSVARRIGANARRARARRRSAEARAVPRTPADSAAELSARELLDTLDEELDRLPERYRLPLVLAYWQGLTQHETASRLGLTLGAVHGRLERGRAKLAERLTRRGFAPASLLAAPLATAAVPADLLAATVALAADPWSKSLPAAVLGLAAIAVPAKLVPAMALGIALVGAGLIALTGGASWRAGSVSDRSEVHPPVAHAPGSPAEVQPAAPRVDRYGDPLPEGAIARIGTSRLMQSSTVAAFSADGQLIATGSRGGPGGLGLVRLWDAKTGKLVREFQPDVKQPIPVTELAFSPDARLLAVSGFWEKSVLLWDVATGRLLHQLPNSVQGHETMSRGAQNSTMAFTANGHTLIIGGKDGGLHLWDTATGREIVNLSSGARVILALTLTTDGATALTAHGDGALHLWDVAQRRHLRQLDVPPIAQDQAVPQMAALAPNGATFARCANRTEVEVRQTATGRVLYRLTDKLTVAGLAFAGNGAFWIARDGGQVSAWDMATGERRRSLTCGGVKPLPSSFAPSTEAWFSPDGRAVAWLDIKSVRLWDLTTGQESPPLAGHRDGTVWIGFTADGRSLLTGGARSEFGVWDASTGLERRPLRLLVPGPPRAWINRYSLSADRRLVALITQGERPGPPSPASASAFLWDSGSDQAPAPLAKQGERTSYAILTPDNRFVVVAETSGREGTLRVYDAATQGLVRTIPGRYSEQLLRITPDGSILAAVAGLPLRDVRLYDFGTGRVLRDLSLPAFVSSLAIAPDSQLLACNCSTPNAPGLTEELPKIDPFISIWHLASGREFYQIPTGNKGADNLVFSPDGRLLAASGTGGTVRLREIASGQERRWYAGHDAGTYALDFAPDGRRIASAGGHDGTALIWQLFDPGAAELTDAELAAQWADLAKDGTTAHRAIGALVNTNAAAPFLAKHLAAEAGIPAERLARLIADLDSPRYATRQEAEKELLGLAEFASAALRQAIANTPSVELRQRAEKLLQALDRPITNSELLRKLRAVEVLEHIGTPDARNVLQRLAAGAPEARLTLEAKASLERLRRTN